LLGEFPIHRLSLAEFSGDREGWTEFGDHFGPVIEKGIQVSEAEFAQAKLLLQ
jgi:hypothetical protein